jgi:hypothetical protein
MLQSWPAAPAAREVQEEHALWCRGKIAFNIPCDPLVERGLRSSGRPQSHRLCNSVFHAGASPAPQVLR